MSVLLCALAKRPTGCPLLFLLQTFSYVAKLEISRPKLTPTASTKTAVSIAARIRKKYDDTATTFIFVCVSFVGAACHLGRSPL